MPQHERILDKRHLPVYELHIRPIADPTAHIAAQDLICVYLRQRQILPQADLPRRFYYKTLHSISYPPFLCSAGRHRQTKHPERLLRSFTGSRIRHRKLPLYAVQLGAFSAPSV